MAPWVSQTFGREYTDEFQRRHAIKKFHVQMATAVDDLDLVLAEIGLPALGDSYAPTPPPCYLRCSSREVMGCGNNKFEYDVVCTYDMDPYDAWSVNITSQTVEYVLDRTLGPFTGVGQPARFTASPAKYLPSMPSGLAQEQILNRAKDPFDPPVMSLRHQSVITLSMLTQDITNTGFPTVGALLANLGKVNSERIQIFSIPDESGMGCDYWTLLMDDISVEKLLRPDGGCDLSVTMRIIYDPLSHCQVVLNSGYGELVGTPKKRRNCRDAGMVDVSAPVPLDANGVAVPVLSLPAAATYIVFPDHVAMNWNVFGFPITFCGISPTPAP